MSNNQDRIPKVPKAWYRHIGRKGGSVPSEKRRLASIENLKLARATTLLRRRSETAAPAP